MELIDKAAVIAEIEKLYKEDYKFLPSDIVESVIDFKDDLLMVLDSPSIVKKEVDLEKEIELIKGDYEQVDVAWNNDFDYIAKHFFELGLKAAQKGEQYGLRKSI